MTTQTATITEFILARVGEDEAEAWAHFPQRWGDPEWEQEHIDRVLAQCKAYRQIVAEHATREVASLERDTWAKPFVACRRCHEGFGRQIIAPCPTLKILAAIWSDHPDYDGTWAL